MKLSEIILLNFWRYKGTQTIKFTTEDRDKNVVVILGENGRGKTGLYRSILFCLYGDRQLSQNDKDNDELKLINKNAVKDNSGKPVECSVTMTFEHNNEIFTMCRRLTAMGYGDKIFEQDNGCTLNKISKEGISEIIPSDKIESAINSILDKRVKDYFIFDGERMENLTKASSANRKELARGIKNLLNIDALNMSISALKNLSKSINQELKLSTGNSEFIKIQNQIEQCEKELKDGQIEIERIENEKELANKEIETLDKELKKYEKIRGLISDRENFNEKIKASKEILVNLNTNMHHIIWEATPLMIRDKLLNTYNFLDEKRERGEIPSEIRKELIERILKEEKCICGRSLNKDTNEYYEIKNWLGKSENKETQNSILHIWSSLGTLKDNFPNAKLQTKNILKNFYDTENTIKEYEISIKQISEKIQTDVSDSKIKDIEKTRQHDFEAIGRLESELIRAESLIKGFVDKAESLNKKSENAFIKMQVDKDLHNRVELTKNTLNALEEILNNYTEYAKKQLSKAATQIFIKLIDTEGRKTLRDVIVNDDYSLQINNDFGEPFLANISAGQRQILSVSFISALALMASKSNSSTNVIQMPLFMDTPFGRLSFDHRKNLIQNIPDYTSQWILLATDTEFGEMEARELYKTGKWARIYRLDSSEDGSTEIKELGINEALKIFATI